MSANRDFKGIWIPKEIWLSKDLTPLQKLFLAEIDSLDNEFGCTANNHYFANFFNCSESSASKTINILSKKDYISTEYMPNSSRILRMKNSFKLSENGGSKKVEGGSKKVDHNNTFNNTLNNQNNNQQQQNENFEKIVVAADPDNDTDNDLHNTEPQQAQITETTEYKPFGVKSLNEVLGKTEPKKQTPKIEKQIKTSALSDVYDFNEMKFEDIAELLFSFNGNKFRESLIKQSLTTNENFKDAVCAFLLQTTATEKIKHLTIKDLGNHFFNWCNRIGKEVIEEKAKQYKKSLTDNNCKIDAQGIFKAFQVELLQKIDKGELKREKALQMAANKKIELGIATN